MGVLKLAKNKIKDIEEKYNIELNVDVEKLANQKNLNIKVQPTDTELDAYLADIESKMEVAPKNREAEIIIVLLYSSLIT